MTVVARIAFVAPPFAGHINPLLQLADAAANSGFEVAFVTGDAKRSAVEGKGFRFHSLPSLTDGVLERIANPEHQIGSNLPRLYRQLRQSLNVTVQAKAELAAHWRADPPDLVVADSIAFIAGLVAQDLHTPWITTAATPFAIECRRGVPSYLGGWSEGSSWAHHLRDATGRQLTRLVKRGFGFLVRGFMRDLKASIYRPDGTEAVYSNMATLGLGIEELEFDRDWPPAFRMIGPLFDNPEPSLPLDLPKGSPRVLVTLGTHLLWAKRDLKDHLAWLAASRPDVTFVGSMGCPKRRADPPERIGPNAMLLPFIPYQDNLDGFDVVIHHGGAGVTYAAITAGKPSLVIPHDYDQFDFAARIVAKGAGLRVRKIKSRRTLAALDRLLAGGACHGLPALSEAARRYRPEEAFLDAVTTALRTTAAEESASSSDMARCRSCTGERCA